MLRKAATASSPVVEISGSFDGVWSITTTTIIKTHKVTFKVGPKKKRRNLELILSFVARGGV